MQGIRATGKRASKGLMISKVQNFQTRYITLSPK